MLEKILKLLGQLFGNKIGKAFSTGALESPVDPRRVALASFLVPVALPSTYEVELGDVKNQGSKPKCVGSATTGLAGSKLGLNLSDDDLYEQCKLQDGIPNVAGTYPAVGASVMTKNGVATEEAYNTKDITKIKVSRELNKMSGYAFVNNDFDSVCQAIFTNGGVIASFQVDSNWYRGIIMKIILSIGGHCTILKGFDLTRRTVKGRNSWGIGWIGYIAGKFDSRIQGGDFEMLWEDYQDNVYDIIAFTYIPKEVKEEATKYDYRFMTTMKYGSRGFEVKKLQERLGITADGSFGKITKKYVIAYQISKGLIGDGIVGKNTRDALNTNVISYISTWAKAIQEHEGYYVGSRSFRNNNPANFKSGTLTAFMMTLGATAVDSGGYAYFPTYEIGFKALCTFLEMACTDRLTSYRGNMTLKEFFAVYAPSGDNNDPLQYAQAVAKKVGATVDTKIVELL